MRRPKISSEKGFWQGTTFIFFCTTLFFALTIGCVDTGTKPYSVPIPEEQAISTVFPSQFRTDKTGQIKASVKMGYMVIPTSEIPEVGRDKRFGATIMAEDRILWIVFQRVSIKTLEIEPNSLEMQFEIQAKSSQELTYTSSTYIAYPDSVFDITTESKAIARYELINFEEGFTLQDVLIDSKTQGYPLDINITIVIEGVSQKDGAKVRTSPMEFSSEVGEP